MLYYLQEVVLGLTDRFRLYANNIEVSIFYFCAPYDAIGTIEMLFLAFWESDNDNGK